MRKRPAVECHVSTTAKRGHLSVGSPGFLVLECWPLMISAPAGYYTLYPRGVGASTAPMPHGYIMVTRWAGAREAKVWMMNGGTFIPSQIGAGERVYVTVSNAPRPAGTDAIRIDFGVPERALQTAGRADWKQLLQPLANVPIYNVAIHVPAAIPASQITGNR